MTNLNIASTASSDTTHFSFLRASSSESVGRSTGEGWVVGGGTGSVAGGVGWLVGGVGSVAGGVGWLAGSDVDGTVDEVGSDGGVTNGEIVGSDGPDAGTEFPK